MRTVTLSTTLLTLLTLTAPPLPAGEVRVIAEIAKVLASDGAADDEFGREVSLDGDRLAIGTWRDNDNGEDAGSAYIFERAANGRWVQVTKILPLDGQPLDQFGTSVSLDGDRLAVGAFGDNDNGALSGSTYIFDRDVNGNWSQVAKLLALDGAAGDLFGDSVSLDGDRVLVSAPLDDDNGDESGSGYIFERDAGGEWAQVTKIRALDGERLDGFGESASLDQGRLAIGATGDDDNGSGSGSAYLFERIADGSWLQVAKLLPLDGAPLDRFGESVSLGADRLAIGAHLDDDNGFASGSVYIFERIADGSWAQIEKIVPLDGAAEEVFGESVSLDGDQLAVGALGNDDNGDQAGSAYVFERNAGGNWVQITRIRPLDGAADDVFGGSVALDAERLAIGAFGDDDSGGQSGSAYLFEPVLVSPQLELSGTCPGELAFTSTGNTPRSGLQLYASPVEGLLTLGDGPCAGTRIDLQNPNLIRQGNSGFSPDLTIIRTVNEFQCGLFLQMLDERTCLTSNVVLVP